MDIASPFFEMGLKIGLNSAIEKLRGLIAG
jgi:hypothetical protein